jgi:pyruvate dehydrogenase E2 component (dihydrolipoamide acetyltransferase)
MAETFKISVPDIGDFDAVDIIEILVKPGDQINIDDPLMTLESDKAAMDVPAEQAGTVREVLVAVGDKVSAGSEIVILEAATKSDKAAQPVAAEKKSLLTDENKLEPIAQQEEDTESEETLLHSPPPTLPPPVERSGTVSPHASPSVRRFARELGADLRDVRGSGAKGRIIHEDVKHFIKHHMQSVGSEPGGFSLPAMTDQDFSKFGDIEYTTLPRIKKISGPHLHRAWLNIPHVTHHDEADITELEAFRQRMKAKVLEHGARLTSLAFIMKALVYSLRAFPQFNSSLTANGEQLVLKKYYHIGIAVDTPNGLMVPVIRDVDRKGIIELAVEMVEISKKARDGKLSPAELQGGSFTISSLGGIGGTAFTPIVNAPEVGILGVTRAAMKPVWDGSEFQPRLMLPLDLSYDHRVIDGAQAARFIVHLADVLGDIRRLLL